MRLRLIIFFLTIDHVLTFAMNFEKHARTRIVVVAVVFLFAALAIFLRATKESHFMDAAAAEAACEARGPEVALSELLKVLGPTRASSYTGHFRRALSCDSVGGLLEHAAALQAVLRAAPRDAERAAALHDEIIDALLASATRRARALAAREGLEQQRQPRAFFTSGVPFARVVGSVLRRERATIAPSETEAVSTALWNGALRAVTCAVRNAALRKRRRLEDDLDAAWGCHSAFFGDACDLPRTVLPKPGEPCRGFALLSTEDLDFSCCGPE